MIKLMEQIGNARKNCQNMSDEDRRKHAEDLILKLAGMMNLEGDEDYDPETLRDYDEEY